MKKALLILLTGMAIGGSCLLYSMAAPEPVSTCISGYYSAPTTYPIHTGWIDTIAGATTDTFRGAISCNPSVITFSNDVFKVAGTPTVTVALYTSSNGGRSYGTTAVTTYTVTPSSLTLPLTNTYVVNGSGGGHNPYTNYMWVATGSASSTVSWRGDATPRQ